MIILNLKNVNYRTLHQKLFDSGINILEFSNDAPEDSCIAENAKIVFASKEDERLAQSIIATHDSTPIPPAPTKEEILEQQIIENNNYLLDVDFRLILIELGMV